MARQNRSHRGDLTERIIRILILLAERPHSQKELAQIFGVNRVTIRRILTELSRHYPIVDEMDGRERIYRFSDHYQFRPPALTPGELAVLLLAQQLIAATRVTAWQTPFGGYSHTLLEKVKAALPKALRGKLDALANISGSAAVPQKDFSRHTGIIDGLTNAAINCRRLRLRYHTLHSGKRSDRLFDPYAVYFDPDGATLKVIGFDHSPHRQTIIPLSIDRIESLSETGEQFDRPPDFDLREFLTKNCFNGIHGEPLTVRLRASGITARIFAERRFHPSQREIARTTDERGQVSTITIELTVARGRGLERFILSYLPEIEVLTPESLKERIAAILKQSLGEG